MKKLFYVGIIGFILFEVANVYFIMPMPGSQQGSSLPTAYFLYAWRWVFRVLFFVMLMAGIKKAFVSSTWAPVLALCVMLAIIYMANFKMAADKMFQQPASLVLHTFQNNKVTADRLVIGVAYNGQAKAYPIQYLGYHHQVRDSIGGKHIMVTYCTVCRTGRVFEPVVNSQLTNFRLVGMDQFNAMFEDERTGSWWRQATGEAVAGKLKGQQLPEVPFMQTSLGSWAKLFPHTQVMQPDEKFSAAYDSMSSYESGKLTGTLTRRDTASWQNKSWVVGVAVDKSYKAYDWNRLQKEKIIYDNLNGKPIALMLAGDGNSFVAIERTNDWQKFSLVHDTLRSNGGVYLFNGVSIDPAKPHLKIIPAYQEYWHSWQTFHPATTK